MALYPNMNSSSRYECPLIQSIVLVKELTGPNERTLPSQGLHKLFSSNGLEITRASSLISLVKNWLKVLNWFKSAALTSSKLTPYNLPKPK